MWNHPCLPPDFWYHSLKSVAADREPTRYPPVRMRILGDLSHAKAISFANRQNDGLCAILIHNGHKLAERAFYDQFKYNEVCQYLPLSAGDSVVAFGIMGYPIGDKLFGPRIALSIDGSTLRNFMSGPYIPKASARILSSIHINVHLTVALPALP